MYTILISDDEVIERNYLKSIIDKYSDKYCLIGEAANGQQVIDMSIRLRPNIIIMDINMPLFNGLEASHIIKSKLKNTIIILNSAYAEFEFARQAIDYELDAYLLKPASEQNILNTIDSCLHKKQLKGQVHGNFASLSTHFIHKYPYSIIDNLTNAIHIRDQKLIQHNILSYLDFLKSQQHYLEEYRLYIINTIFTITRVVNMVMPENGQVILNSDEHLLEISRAEYWYEILTLTEDFFNRLLYLFKEDSIFMPDCTDLVAKYIDEHFNRQITLEHLADIFHFNQSYISRTFHKNKGVTITSYINQQRIKHAVYLLETSNLSIKSIAHTCGFANVSHFNRVFKDITGKIPSQFKKKGIM